jgi:hypothetical protein
MSTLLLIPRYFSDSLHCFTFSCAHHLFLLQVPIFLETRRESKEKNQLRNILTCKYNQKATINNQQKINNTKKKFIIIQKQNA